MYPRRLIKRPLCRICRRSSSWIGRIFETSSLCGQYGERLSQVTLWHVLTFLRASVRRTLSNDSSREWCSRSVGQRKSDGRKRNVTSSMAISTYLSKSTCLRVPWCWTFSDPILLYARAAFKHDKRRVLRRQERGANQTAFASCILSGRTYVCAYRTRRQFWNSPPRRTPILSLKDGL